LFLKTVTTSLFLMRISIPRMVKTVGFIILFDIIKPQKGKERKRKSHFIYLYRLTKTDPTDKKKALNFQGLCF
jgi:hypothetical protein